MRKRQAPKRDTRFKPGVSGNPKGRPRKPSATTQGRETLIRLLNEEVAHRNGKPVTAFEAMLLKVRKTILDDGKLADFTKFIDLCQSFGVLEPPKDETQEQQTGVLLVREPCKTAEEWVQKYGEAARGKPAPAEFQNARRLRPTCRSDNG